MADKGNKRVNDAPSPADNQSLPSRVNATFGRNYKPQHNTLSTERRYQYNKDKKGPQELRFGTQAQRQDGQTKVSPAFKLWLKNQPSTTIASMFSPSSPAQRITHIYFNNLGRDRSDPEGLSERRMTQALENLENEHDNLAVITLPADKGLFAANDYQTTTENLNFDQEFQRLFNIATNNSSEAIKDFYISPSVRTMIYGDKEQETVNKLLSLSFSKMGAAADKPLSKAQRQAIWFDFNKYAFPNLAIETLDPKTFNFTCKDAIDRAGVSSAYYNLMKSIELENPMSREEFECGLHAAPAMVKGRGMNHHVELLWNAIDFYINANYEKLRGQVPWLVQWRDDNCPHNRAQEVLRIRIQQARIDLDKATCDFPLKKDQIAQTARLIDMIEEQAKKNTSGNRLLLQAVSDSIDLIENPSPRKVNSYKNLADRLEVKNPTWRAIGGIMKIIAGMITYAFSPKLLHSGIATFKTAQNAEQRKQIQLAMKKMIQKNEEEEIQPGHSTPIVG